MSEFDHDIKINIKLNKMVEVRAKLQTQYEDYSSKISKGEYLDENDIDRIATKLRDTLTWDALFCMVDDAVLEYLDIKETHYGEIQPEPGREAELTKRESEAKKRKQYFEKNFEMVTLDGGSWQIEVPRRK